MTTLSSEANKIFVLGNHVFWTCHALYRRTIPGMLLESFICLFGTYFSSPLLQKPGALITMKSTAQVMEKKNWKIMQLMQVLKMI